MFSKRYISLFFLCCMYASTVCSQVQNKLLLRQINTFGGLSNNHINCIFEDSRGFIWIGTYDGLNRYDGKNISVYRRNLNDSNSLSNNWITSINEDDKGNLWVGTYDGVSVLNSLSGLFTNYNGSQFFPGVKTSSGEFKILKDNSNTIWICSGGLSYFDEKKKQFITQPFIPKDNAGRNQLVTSATFDDDGNIWMGTFEGLYEYNVSSKTYKKFEEKVDAEKYSKFGDLFGMPLKINNHAVLAASWENFLYNINTQTGEMKMLPMMGKADIRPFQINWNGNKEFWIAHNHGIERFDENLNKINNDSSALNLDSSFSKAINCIFQSSSGIIFVGTNEGVDIINPHLQVFKTYFFPKTKNYVSGNAGNISSIIFGKKNLFAGGLYSNGLYVLNDKWQLIKSIKTFSPLTRVETNTQTYDMLVDNGFAWLATFQGLIKVDLQNFNFNIFLPNKTDSLFFRHKRFLMVRKDSKGKIWLANYKQDLASFDTGTKQFKFYLPFNSHESIWGLAVTKKNEVWVASGDQLAKYDAQKDAFDVLKNQETKGVFFETIIEGKDNELWIASHDGIWKFNTQTNAWNNWNTDDGLCNNYVNNILFDNSGRLWIMSAAGLSAFDTAEKKFFNFTSRDGLPYDNLDGAMAINDEGKIFLGGDNSITFFNPDEAVNPSKNYPAYIFSCIVNGKKIEFSNSDSLKKISLKYNQNNFDFQFTVVNFLQPFQTNYYYKLEGFDTAWHTSSNGNINYTNLDAGKYILRVSSNPKANAKQDSIIIIIHKPFWKKWWFILLCFILIAAIIFFIVRKRISNIRTEANRRAIISQQFADLRMKALRSQMNPHFLFNSLNAIQECCLTGQIDTATQYLARFSKLVRSILENSDKQWISLHDEINILKLYLDVESLRFANSFHYTIENKTEVSSSLIKIPPMLVQPFVENAIWHGLLRKDGERNLWLRFYTNDETLFIEIEDNGIGRAATKKQGHQSMGTNIVDERMKLLQQSQNISANIEIIDKKDEAGNAAGTLVKLKIAML